MASFEDWARGHAPVLLRTAYLLVADQHRAEDLVQQTLERVAPGWERIEHPDAYARQVLYRLRAGDGRRRRVSEVLVSVPPEISVRSASGSVDTKLAVADALRRLTPSQRRVLVLRYYEDLSEREVAQILGCSVGTVKSQAHKALAALRRAAPGLSDLSAHEGAAHARR